MPAQLHAIIVGAGVGGLVLGTALRRLKWRVTILERASRPSEVGAGIQLAPNATRILRRMGLLDEVSAFASCPNGTIVRRYLDDTEIGPRSHNASLQARFDCPMLVIHRADLQSVLLQAATSSGARIRFESKVESIDPSFVACATLSTGEKVYGDVLIGADGINSRVREAIADTFKVSDKVIPSGDHAYRVTVPRSRLRDCPEILAVMDQEMSTRWIGPGGHIMAYPVRHAELYNVVMVHSSSTPADSPCKDNGCVSIKDYWARKGDISELLSFYGSWSPMVQHLAGCIDPTTLMEWPLVTRAPLPAWHRGQVSLLGDSAHAMLPYVAQGAAQAIEDAAVLAICLDHLSSSPTDIENALSLYERLRKSRAEYIQSSASQMRRVLHLADGAEQEARDAAMRCTIRDSDWKHPDLWADPEFQNLVWGKDVVKEAEIACQNTRASRMSQSSSNIDETTNRTRGSEISAMRQRYRVLTASLA